MVRIEVWSDDVEVVSGVSRTHGDPYSFKRQSAFVVCPSRSPGKGLVPHTFRFRVADPGYPDPYPPGVYTLAPESLCVLPPFAKLGVRSSVRLVPVGPLPDVPDAAVLAAMKRRAKLQEKAAATARNSPAA